MRVSEKHAIAAAVFAIADMGGKIHVPGFDASNYGATIQRAIVADMKEAWAISAFCIDRVPGGGYRLCKYCKGSGQADVGPIFNTASAFNDAMCLLSAITSMTNA